MHSPQAMQSFSIRAISGSGLIASGLWHQTQASGQPLKKTVVRMGPSSS
jgi:hypothetical protein